ncbi:hypothetical protein M011DRAFT_467946 [Sporormia fimetaria CBS 119925]|uniref:Uncharacterized protein n=1 Tax=Sporormia fimetaria CBS 119925 TaxID=1340428 RepID=A0A6A6VBG7_9PLEO|nr:hypothetical protein M011DRAFT_467946 [Sporormia fimetaria CBS 119925]
MNACEPVRRTPSESAQRAKRPLRSIFAPPFSPFPHIPITSRNHHKMPCTSSFARNPQPANAPTRESFMP